MTYINLVLEIFIIVLVFNSILNRKTIRNKWVDLIYAIKLCDIVGKTDRRKLELKQLFTDAKTNGGKNVGVEKILIDFETGEYLLFHGKTYYDGLKDFAEDITWLPNGRAIHNDESYDIVKKDYYHIQRLIDEELKKIKKL